MPFKDSRFSIEVISYMIMARNVQVIGGVSFGLAMRSFDYASCHVSCQTGFRRLSSRLRNPS